MKSGWFRPVSYAGWEIAWMRVFLAIAVYLAFGKIQTFPAAEVEIGLGRGMNLSLFHQPGGGLGKGVFGLLPRNLFQIIVLIGMLVYASGRLGWLVLPVVTFLFIGTATLNTSQGSIQHHLQAGAMLLVVLSLWYVGCAIWNKTVPLRALSLEKVHRFVPFFAIQVLAATYVVAGISKLEKSGIGWIADTRFAPVALRKTADQHFFSVTDHLPERASGLFDGLPVLVRGFFLECPWAAGPLLGPGLFLELFAFLALAGRRAALVVGLLIIGFHYAVSEVMNLRFEMNTHLLLIFMVNVPFWVGLGWRKGVARFG